MPRAILSLCAAIVLTLGLTATVSASNHNCPDYPTQEAAQAAYEAGGHDDLDADNDGIACESNPSGGTSTDTSGTGGTVTTPATGVGPLGSSGTSPWTWLLAALATVIGAVGLRVRRA